MQRPFLVVTLISCFFILSCGKNSIEAPTATTLPHPAGSFVYTGLYQGQPCVTGWLLFTKTTPNQIQGTWLFGKSGCPGVEIGPQQGRGYFEGSGSTQFHLNLNPNLQDNNVTLTGTFSGKPFESHIEGTWDFSGLFGTVTNGTFYAEQ